MATQARSLIQEKFSFKPLTFQGLNESEGVQKDERIDGVRIIGKVVGEAFAVNGKTRNNRWYSERCWEETIKEAAERFPLFGTCGHDVEFNEANIKKGELTHLVTKMWIDENGKGMIEMLIRGNEYGRNVYEAMVDGYPMAVSTRAYGDVLKGKGPGGSDLIVEGSLYLECVDFVCNPGHRDAFPRVVESLDNQEGTEEKVMDEKTKELFESLNKDNVDTRVSLKEALVENQKLNEKVASQTKMLEAVQEKLGTDPVKSLEVIEEGLRKWMELEPFKSFSRAGNLFGKTTEPPMQSVLEHLHKVTESYVALGTPEQLKAIKESNEKYLEYGTPESLEESYTVLKGFAAFKKTPEQMKVMLESSAKLIGVYKNAKLQLAAKQISEKFKVNKEVVTEMLKKDTAKNVIDTLSKLNKVNESVAPGSRVATGAQGTVIPTKLKSETGAGKVFESIKTSDKKENSSKSFLAEVTRARK